MFRTFSRRFLPNPFDRLLRKAARRGDKKILLGWNRGLGDISLGLYAIVHRILEHIPGAEITFITRKGLADGFSMLEGVKILTHAGWERGKKCTIDPELKSQFDLVIENPSPTDWVFWQYGKLTPKLKWDPKHDELYKKFNLDPKATYVGVQPITETEYGLWRNWSQKKWEELFSRLEKQGIQVLLFGFGNQPQFSNSNVVDLRGKTNLFELLSIIKHRTFSLILPDSGIASFVYYCNEQFPIKLITLWADPNHGIIKQDVDSPNALLQHSPLISQTRDLETVNVNQVIDLLGVEKKVLAILLAAGQGTRLGFEKAKGLFEVGGKTLFEWILEKIPKKRPLAVMTSSINHDEIVAYFKENQFFGLDVHFFQQEMAPLLDAQKKPLDLVGPTGNGAVFSAFLESGLEKTFGEIDLITVSYIDNPLSNPYDPGLIASIHEADVAIQCIERNSQDQSMGALIEKDGKTQILEYTDLDPEQEYKYAYSGQLVFRFPFFCKMGKVKLPVHWVKKEVDGQAVWKGEHFIFDVFPFAKKVRCFPVNRKTHYAPIKHAEHIESALRELG